MSKNIILIALLLTASTAGADSLLLGCCSWHSEARPDGGEWNESNPGIGYQKGFYEYVGILYVEDSDDHDSINLTYGRRYEFHGVYPGFLVGLFDREDGIAYGILPTLSIGGPDGGVDLVYIPKIEINGAQVYESIFVTVRVGLGK
jgi:hypothetical protein